MEAWKQQLNSNIHETLTFADVLVGKLTVLIFIGFVVYYCMPFS